MSAGSVFAAARGLRAKKSIENAVAVLMATGHANQIPTSDKRFIWIDTTARWRIADPLLFFKTVATERGAQSRLDDIIDSVVRDAVSG